MELTGKCIAVCIALSLSVVAQIAPAEEVEITEQQMKAFLDEKAPELLTHLQELSEEKPEAYEERVNELREHIAAYYEIKARNPELADLLLNAHRLDFQSWKLAERVAETDDPDLRQTLKTDLRELLEEVFDVRVRQHQIEIDELRREVRQISELVEKRKQNRERIIEHRLNELIARHDEALEWW